MAVDPVRRELPLVTTQPKYASCNKPDIDDLEQLRKKLSLFDSSFPVEQYQHAWSLPPSLYNDDQIYKAMCQMFKQNWVAVGSVSDIATPGHYFTVNVAGEPVVVLRDKDDTLRAYSNFCRHRAKQILTEPNGKLDNIVCRYHGWEYDPTTGIPCRVPRLGAVKEPSGEKFNPEEHGLVPFEVDTWGPLVFIRMKKGESSSSLSTILAPLIQRTKDINLSSWQWGGRKEYIMNCGLIEYNGNFLDGGNHVETVHPELAGALDLNKYHTEVFDYCSLQSCPTKDTKSSKTDVRQGSLAMYWWAFPNVMVDIYHCANGYMSAMDTNIVLPLGPNKCKVIFDFYFDKGWKKPSIQKYIKGADKTQLQDVKVCEELQPGLMSEFSKPGPYEKPEIGEYHFHKLLAHNLKAAVEQQQQSE